MTLIKEIDLLESKKTIIWLNVASVILMILFIFLEDIQSKQCQYL